MRSVHELCSDWHALYTQCPLLTTPWAGGIHCSLLHSGTFIHGLRCAASSSTDEFDIIYLWYIYNLNSRLAHLYALWMEYVCFELESWRTILWCSLCRALTYALRTNIWSNKSNIRNVQSGGGARTGIEKRWLHTACLLQVMLTKLFIKARCRLLK